MIGDIVAGINPKIRDMPFKLAWDKKKQVLKAKRRAKRQEMDHQRRTGRIVVAYGDASVNSSMKNFADLPQKAS